MARLNSTLEDYPLASFVAYIGSGLLTFGCSFAVLSALHFDAPALAVAGLVSKLSKKARMPLDAAAAASLAHVAPWTNALKLGPLLSPMRMPPEEAKGESATAKIESTTAKTEFATQFEQRIVGFVRWAEGPVNRFGCAFHPFHRTIPPHKD